MGEPISTGAAIGAVGSLISPDIRQQLGSREKRETEETREVTPGELTPDEQSMLDSIYRSLGFARDPATGEYNKAGPTGTEKRLGDFATTLQEAFSSEYTDPALEADLQRQEKELRAGLASRLGPDYETTSSGIQALSQFQSRADIARTGARTTRQTALGGQAGDVLETLAGTEQAGAGTLAELFEYAGAIKKGRQKVVGRQTTKSKRTPGMFEMIGSLLGGAGQAAGGAGNLLQAIKLL